MKQLFVLAGCLVMLSVVAGCQSANSAKITVEGGQGFPDFLAGRWQAKGDSRWEFMFEPDGRISYCRIGMGGAMLKPGQTTVLPTHGGGEAVFKPGRWSGQYSPDTRDLTVKIVVDDIHFEMGEDLLEGKRKDVFSGEVLKDELVWLADWYSFPDYMAYGSQIKRLTIRSPEESFVKTLTFQKVSE